MNNQTDDYYTRIEDIEDDLPDRVIRDLNGIGGQNMLDDVSSQFTIDAAEVNQKQSFFSLLGETLVLFVILFFVLNKRFVKYVGDFNLSLSKNILFSLIASLVFFLYKLILWFY